MVRVVVPVVVVAVAVVVACLVWRVDVDVDVFVPGPVVMGLFFELGSLELFVGLEVVILC